jgi:hypothetical protein
MISVKSKSKKARKADCNDRRNKINFHKFNE